MPDIFFTAGNIHPDISVLGNKQSFYFTKQLSGLRLLNKFIPTANLNQNTVFEFLNNMYNGFRFVHETSNTDTCGSIGLRYFTNANDVSTPIFVATSNSVSFNTAVSGLSPTTSNHFAIKSYVDTHTWISSQITDFNTAVRSNTLSQLAAPTSNVSFNNFKITSLANPTVGTDAATKSYVDSAVGNVPSSITLTGDVTGSGTTSSSITTTMNKKLNEITAPTGNVNMNNYKIVSLAAPTTSYDAVTKYYADSLVSPINTKLQYFSYWDSVYPNYFTRSIYINNSYDSGFNEYAQYGYLNSNGNTGTASDAPVYDLKCNGRIRASEFNAWSSRNIKNILETGKKASEEAAKIIRDMPIVKYNYKDQIIDGAGEFFGIISEEILSYLPYYVSTQEFRFIPNIMKFGKLNNIDNRNFTILLNDKIDLKKDVIGKKIQVLIDQYSFSAYLISIDRELISIELEKELLITDKDIDVFVYGTYEDCPTVSLKHLSELVLCALQNCLTRIEQLEKR